MRSYEYDLLAGLGEEKKHTTKQEYDRALKGVKDLLENTRKMEHHEWKTIHGHRLTDDEMLTRVRDMFEQVKKKYPIAEAKEVTDEQVTDGRGSKQFDRGRTGWNALHAFASGLDSALGIGSEECKGGEEKATRLSESVDVPILSSGPNSDLMWLNM